MFDNIEEVPGYSQIVDLSDILGKENDTNLNIRRYVDNTPPQEPHDVRAHVLGGIPNAEIAALNGLLTKYGIQPEDIFSSRGDGYSDFREAASDKVKIHALISGHAGVVASNEKMHTAFESFWETVVPAVDSVRNGLGITDFTNEYKISLAAKLEPVGILDHFQSLGVFANWWDHTYTVREYTDIEEDAEGNQKKVDIKETIDIRNVFKTIHGEGFVSSLVSDDKIAKEHFADELAEIDRLYEETQAAQAELMAYISSIDIGSDDEDEESDDENAEPKDPTVKEVRDYLKSLDTEEAKQQLKKVKNLEKAKNAANRVLKKEKEKLQKKVDGIRSHLTEEQCRVMVLQLLHESFTKELDKYLNAEVMETVRAVQKLWEKYFTSASELLAQRQAAEDKLNEFLKKLGYLS